VRQLPSPQQQEVLNFVEFLEHKYLQTDEISGKNWLTAALQNPSLTFLHDEAEDVYSLEDGKPYRP
jgi:hypothetical protein